MLVSTILRRVEALTVLVCYDFDLTRVRKQKHFL
jgi:hypothetical protein